MNEILQNRSGDSFSLSKIPLEQEEQIKKIYDTDKIKILELSNIIDKWEEEVLFSSDGYFSLQGKDVQNKSKEIITELSSFIESKIQECSFENSESKNIAVQIKNEKISSISEKMKIYEYQQLKNWENSVYEEAVNSCINRAVLYKDDEDVVQKSFLNGISVLNIMAEKENWNNKTLKARTDKFQSDFYYALIKAFMNAKDVKADKYFSKYKDILLLDNKDDLAKSTEEMKKNIISYNLSKEIFSYNLEPQESEKYIKKIADENIEKNVRKYLKDFSLTAAKEKRKKEKEAKEQDWQTIISEFERNPNDVFVYIDYTLSQEHINSVKKYIEQMKRNGFIKSDKNKFIELIKEIFEDFQSFTEKDISDYRADFSNEDFDIIAELQSMKQQDFDCLYSDYRYSCEKLTDTGIEDVDKQYEYSKLYLKMLNEYKQNNGKNADLKTRNDIINTVLQRFSKTNLKNEVKQKIN